MSEVETELRKETARLSALWVNETRDNEVLRARVAELEETLKEIAKGTEHPCVYCFECANIAKRVLAQPDNATKCA